MRCAAGFVSVILLLCGIACVGTPLPPLPGYSQKYRLDEEIPIPPGGYQYLESESFTYISPTSDSLRVAELHLVGDTRVDEIVSFYERQMKLHNYEFIEEVPSKVAHKVSLLFKNRTENEEVRIEVERKGTRVHIKIDVYPT
jgi:hypothetical protein